MVQPASTSLLGHSSGGCYSIIRVIRRVSQAFLSVSVEWMLAKWRHLLRLKISDLVNRWQHSLEHTTRINVTKCYEIDTDLDAIHELRYRMSILLAKYQDGVETDSLVNSAPRLRRCRWRGEIFILFFSPNV